MKKICILTMFVFWGAAYGAQTPLGIAVAENQSAPQYLISAADAWNSVIGTPWRGGAIATRMSDMQQEHNNSRLYDVMSVLAYNNTAMTIYQTNLHLDAAYAPTEAPLLARRAGATRNFIISANGIAATDKFDHEKNDDFEMRTGGGGVSAYAYVTQGLTFGVGYSYAKSKSHDMPLDVDATSNTISLFSKYLSDGGWYMNTALAAGQVKWDLDKSLVGVANKTSFDTDFYSAQIISGVKLNRGRVFLAPGIGMRYTRLTNEKHVDAAAQDFKKWWYNTLTARGEIEAGANFTTGGMLIRPTLNIGGGYDIIHHGTDKVATRLLTGQSYDMPVHAPGRSVLAAGGGIGLYGAKIAVVAKYTLNTRSDYRSHDIKASLKIAF